MDTDILREARRQQDADMTTFKDHGDEVRRQWRAAGLERDVMARFPRRRPCMVSAAICALLSVITTVPGKILYSDSWGPGHELKRLSLVDAWTMTLGLYTVQPRDIHFWTERR